MAAAPRTEALNGSRWAPPSCPQRLMGHLVRAVTHKRDWRESRSCETLKDYGSRG